MCEFCNLPSKGTERDAAHSDFAGFFSADAIEAAVRQANATRKSEKKDGGEGEEDDDGT